MSLDNIDGSFDIYKQLERDEGRRSFPYKDTQGNLTIGVGHNLDGKGLPDGIIDTLLVWDVDQVHQDLCRLLTWYEGLDPIRQGVLLNMGFNMGVTGLLGFHKMLTHMQAGEWADAALEMMSSRWASQVGPRAARLASQMRSGQWQ